VNKMIKAWFFRTIGNWAFVINGGLDRLEKENWLRNLMDNCYGIAYISEEQAAGRLPEGLK
jgi:hypothetical protein